MGYDLAHVLPEQEAHAQEFICAICFNLVDTSPLLTTCNHVFCSSCLQDWFDNKPCCPTCTQELDPRNGAGELRLASPIAYRVLGRLRVKCSLPECKWVGEYSEVSAHLMSAETHQTLPAAKAPALSASAPRPSAPAAPAAERTSAAQESSVRVRSAEALKAEGNNKYEQRQYHDAVVLYTKAINMVVDVAEAAKQLATYYLNRSAAYSSWGRFEDSIADCQSALKIERTNGKAYKRMARAYCELGDYNRGKALCEEGASASGGESTVVAELSNVRQLCEWHDEGDAAMALGNYSLARTFFANMLSKTSAPLTKLKLVRAELGLGLTDRALRTTRDVIKSHPNISDAYMLRGEALLLASDIDQASKHLREALRLDPDNSAAGRTMKKVRKLERHVDAAKQASTQRDFEGAKENLTEALDLLKPPEHAPISSKLHAERGAARLRLKEYDAALKDCALAIYAQDDCKDAWLTKAQALHALGRHEEAYNEMVELQRQCFQSDPQVSHAVQRASFEVRKLKRPDYYGLLEVPSIASQMEIKGAYKQQALKWHPDKHNETEESRRTAEARFKLLGEALEILGDDFQRKLYNEGYDREAIAERVQAANRAANQHDRDGCCNRGGGCGGCG